MLAGLPDGDEPMALDAPNIVNHLIFGPDDVDLSRSPLRRGLIDSTHVLGVFNPGMTRLPGGNLLLMVRVAEALDHPVDGATVRTIRWTDDGYVTDPRPLADVDSRDPRQFVLAGRANRLLCLTSLSWLLPVELDRDGTRVVAVHYDRIVAPAARFQDCGLEDPRISRIGDLWYMTVCAASAERQSTLLYIARNGLDYHPAGMVLDHQNKDMVLFEGMVGDHFMALTRPLGEVYLAYPARSPFAAGPSINLARSPDGLHWKPLEAPFIRARAGSTSAAKVGGGPPPIRTEKGWLMLYHGVEPGVPMGSYRCFWALLDADDPSHLLRLEDETPLLEADPALLAPLAGKAYLPAPVVFPTGIVNAGDHYLVASGEGDLACRLSRIPLSCFS